MVGRSSTRTIFNTKKSYLGRTGTATYDAQKTRAPALGMYQAEA